MKTHKIERFIFVFSVVSVAIFWIFSLVGVLIGDRFWAIDLLCGEEQNVVIIIR